MSCNCRWIEIILAVIIVVFAVWQTPVSQWVLIIAGLVLLAHAILCKNCGVCKPKAVYSPVPKVSPKVVSRSAPKKKKKKR